MRVGKARVAGVDEVYGFFGSIEFVQHYAAVGWGHVSISGEVDGLVEYDVGAMGQQPWRGAQTQKRGVEVRPFVVNAVDEGVDVGKVVSEHVDERSREFASVEPNPAEQFTASRTKVSVGVVEDFDAGQSDVSGELLGEVVVIDEAHLLSEPVGYFLPASGLTE